MTPLIEARKLTIQDQHGRKLVDNLSFSLASNSALTILGESGAGKSILAQALLGILPSGICQTGEIKLFGKPLTKISQSQLEAIWAREICLLPQEPSKSLNPIMPMRRQISEVFEFVHLQKYRKATQSADESLIQLNLDGHGAKVPSRLSGGMAQRVAYAAATAAGGKVLIADEPTKGLDRRHAAATIKRLAKYRDHGGLITITHNLQLAEELGGTIIIMRDGQIIEQGNASAVLTEPKNSYTQQLISAAKKKWNRPQKLQQPKPIITLENVSLSRGSKQLFHDFNLTISEGEIIGMVGESGKGKSSLADLSLKLLKPKSGSINYHFDYFPAERPNVLKLSQDPATTFPAHHPLQILLTDLQKKHGFDQDHVEVIMNELGLSEKLLGSKPHQLSGGELQRFSLLFILLLRPRYIVADEPTSRLDMITAEIVNKALLSYLEKHRAALLYITHDRRLVNEISHRVIDLDQAN